MVGKYEICLAAPREQKMDLYVLWSETKGLNPEFLFLWFWENLTQYQITLLSIFVFLGLGGVFLGVKNNSKNFGNKKNIGLFSKILSKWTLFYSKSSDLFNLYDFVQFKMSKNHSKSYNICYLYTCMHKYWLL